MFLLRVFLGEFSPLLGSGIKFMGKTWDVSEVLPS